MSEAVNDDDRVLWEVGLPGAGDLSPLTLQLIPPELAHAFKISPESSKTMTDVNRASQNTFSSLQRWHSHDMSSIKLSDEEMKETVTEKDETDLGSDPRKLRRVVSDGAEEADSALNKRARLVWTPQLHKRFVEVVAHLGIKSAVPKNIMQLMNVEGLTRENVASHLQKYRLFTKRQSIERPAASDHSPDCGESGHAPNTNGHVAMQYSQQMMPMPIPMTGHVGMPDWYGAGFNQRYNMMPQQQWDWSGNNFGYYHQSVASNDK